MRKFERRRHIRYFTSSLGNLPKQYSSADTNRLSLIHFCVQSLDILGCLPGDSADDRNEEGVVCCGIVEEDVYIDRVEIIDWIYGLTSEGGVGFKGSNYLGGGSTRRNPYDHSHIAMTYVAICTLKALGDDLSRIDKVAILSSLKGLQNEDGSFVAISLTHSNATYGDDDVAEAEDDCDLRFMYAAIAVWYILTSDDDDDYDSKNAYINVESATQYILSCRSYEGALGLTPGREGHGGSTFCGIASLYLMGVLDDVMSREELRGWKEELIYWCVMRQCALFVNSNNNNNGFVMEEKEQPAGIQGRPNKLEDTCYSYWIGGTLHLLSSSHLIDGWALREYVLTCQSPYGGFGKVVGAMPDLLHSFYSMAWLTLSKEGGCCDDDELDDVSDHVGVERREEVERGDTNHKGSSDIAVVRESEATIQVTESIDRLSKLDCALGMCAKRIK